MLIKIDPSEVSWGNPPQNLIRRQEFFVSPNMLFQYIVRDHLVSDGLGTNSLHLPKSQQKQHW